MTLTFDLQGQIQTLTLAIPSVIVSFFWLMSLFEKEETNKHHVGEAQDYKI